MSTRAFMDEEEFDDFADVPLKLHSVLEFLDPAVASVDGTTERQHVSSADSESEEDGRGCDTPPSLRLTPYVSAAAIPNATAPIRQCFCTDKTQCMCSLLALPPLLPRPSSVAPVAMTNGLTSSNGPYDFTVPSASVVDTVHFVPLQLTGVYLTKPTTNAAPTSTTALTRTSTRTTCCRC